MNFNLVIQLLLSNFENKGSRYLKFLQIIYFTYLCNILLRHTLLKRKNPTGYSCVYYYIKLHSNFMEGKKLIFIAFKLNISTYSIRRVEVFYPLLIGLFDFHIQHIIFIEIFRKISVQIVL